MTINAAIRYRATCDHCGEDAPEWRNSRRKAERDIDECPCREKLDQEGAPNGGD